MPGNRCLRVTEYIHLLLHAWIFGMGVVFPVAFEAAVSAASFFVISAGNLC